MTNRAGHCSRALHGSAAPTADLVLRNGAIWCGRNDGMVEAVAIWQGRVLATGSDAEIAPLIGPSTRVVDLDGKFATPGLNDAHLHLVSLGIDDGLGGCQPKPRRRSKHSWLPSETRARQLRPGEWILARGYDQTKLDVKRHPHRERTRCGSPDNPVMLVRACGHISICNSRALELAGIDENSPTPPGGLIEQANGSSRAFWRRMPRARVWAVIPPPTEDDLVDGIERGGRHLLSYGITSCMDAAVGQRGGFGEIAAYHRAKREGRLPVRTWLVLLGDPDRSIVPQCYEAGSDLRHRRRHADDRRHQVSSSMARPADARPGCPSPILAMTSTTGVQMMSDERVQRRSSWTPMPKAISSPATPSAMRRSSN